MNWTTEKINAGAVYSFSQVERQSGISRATLLRWRKSGRLITISTRRSFVSGQRLIEAIENRLMQ